MKKLTKITIGGKEPALCSEGRIKVEVLDYDIYFDRPLLDSDVKKETTKRLKALFQPQNRN